MNTEIKTIDFIKEHCRNYPKLQIQDLLKAFHQSVFGCGHFVSDKALTFLNDELNNMKESDSPDTETLDGDFSRVYLNYLTRHGLSADTIFKLFVMSSEMHCGDTAILESKLEILLKLSKTGQIPFSYNETKVAIDEWRKKNYSACRHSEAYRSAYSPAYRVIHNDFIKWLPLFSAIDKYLQSSKQMLVAIEGGSASGKTTLSGLLSEIYDCNVFHMDDFFLRPEQRTKERLNTPGGNVDSERFLKEVLIPMRQRQTVEYKRFDCSIQEIIEPINIVPRRLNIIEGAYSMHPTLSEYYDLSVFLDVDKDLQIARILKRNSEPMQKRFINEWIPMEEKYFNEYKVKESCNMCLEIKE